MKFQSLNSLAAGRAFIPTPRPTLIAVAAARYPLQSQGWIEQEVVFYKNGVTTMTEVCDAIETMIKFSEVKW